MVSKKEAAVSLLSPLPSPPLLFFLLLLL